MQYFNNRLDVFLVNYFLDPAQVGLYMLAVMITELLLFVPRSVGFVLFPRVASFDRITSSNVMPLISRQTLLITAIGGVSLVVISPFAIPFVYGNTFAPSVQAILLLIPGIVMLSLGWVLSSYLDGYGLPHYVSYLRGITLIVTIVLDLTLIPKLGIAGAALASTGAYTIYTLCSMAAVWYVARIKPSLLSLPRREDFERWRNIITQFLYSNK